MEKWTQKNREAFERDVLHDFCRMSVMLFAQFERYAKAQTISFPVLRDMIGEPLNKGLLWRLKDKAHHIFTKNSPEGPASMLLDWTLGYIFHETLKLTEDAHQRQYYAPTLSDIRALFHSEQHKAAAETQPEAHCASCDAPRAEKTADAFAQAGNGQGTVVLRAGVSLEEQTEALFTVQNDTAESMRREAARLEILLKHARLLFCRYFHNKSDHRLLARFLFDKNDLVRSAFREDYAHFLEAVYTGEHERLYVEAALSLLESDRSAEAHAAVTAALALNPECRDALSLKEANIW